MFRTLSRRRVPNRRGAILLVVLTLLALFAVIGLSFALYAESEATAARIHREGENQGGDPLPGSAAQQDANLVLSQFLFGVPDGPPPSDPSATQISTLLQMQSGLRGQSLGRTMYGYDIRAYLGSTAPDVNRGLSPFAGLGLFPMGADTITTIPGLPPIDRGQVINYAVYLPGTSGGTMYCFDPEWSQFRTSLGAPGLLTFTNGTRTYRPVHAPYTYPDLKDLYLAAINPTTGTVTQPSFYRTYGAFTTTGGAGLITGLEPSNTNWGTSTNPVPQGRLLILRPRPVDHIYDSNDGRGPVTDFPAVPPNADGTYTGDVQNLPSPQGQQHNDAIWIYPGGPIHRWNGKLYTMMVAATVVDLNGRVNLSMAGNIKNANTPPNKTSASNAGVGAHEINPQWVFDNAATRSNLTTNSQTGLMNIISGLPGMQGRYGVTSALPPADRFTGLSMASFNNGLVPPSYSLADFDGVGNGATDRANPAGTGTSPFPAYQSYTTRYFNSTTQSSELGNHPSQFSPDFWSPTRTATTGRTFPPDDLRRLAARYADDWSKYYKSDLAKLAPQYLASQYYPTGAASTTDQANLVRMLTTTQSSSLTRPELQVPTGPPAGMPPVTPFARLGPIDMNRPLSSFRPNTALPLDPKSNFWMGNQAPAPSYPNYAQARRARQNFARDIFIRLAAIAGQIDGTNVAYSPANGCLYSPASMAAPNPLVPGGNVPAQQFNNLQSIAQIAANLVDYIDPDDISTSFVWNPVNPTYNDAAAAPMGGTFIDPSAHANNFAVSATSNQMGQSVVFGSELPRLVVSEAYAEVTNNQADIGQNNASKPFRMAFWVELVNPLGAAGDPALSDGGAGRLQYQGGRVPAGTAYPVHQLLISYPDPTKPASSLSTALGTTPSNVTGDPFQVANLTTKVQVWNYSPSALPNPAPVPPPSYDLVLPVQGAQSGTANSNTGYYVIGPQQQNGADIFPGGPVPCTLWLADPTNPPQPGVTVNSMVYEHSGNTSTDLTGAGGANLLGRKHTVILQRLANPYLPPNDPNWVLRPATAADPVATAVMGVMGTFNPALPVNPYITVDFLENVPTRDRVTVTGDQPPRMAPAGQDTNPSVGRRHVYGAGNGYLGQAHDGTNNVNQPVTQQAAPAAMMPAPTPAHSFFYANNPFGDPGGGALAAGTLPWMAHYDRQLLNPLEMIGVSAVSPALLTQNFVYWPQGMAAAPPTYNRHSAESLFLPGLTNGVLSFYTPTVTPAPAGSPPYPVVQPSVALSQAQAMPPPPTSPLMAGFLARGLDMLTVRSFLNGVPVGGREQGKLNVNTIWHPAVLRALLDSNTGNYFTDSDVNAIWQQLTNVDPVSGTPGGYTATRSQWNTSPYNTTAADAPFWGLSAADPTLNAPVANPMSLPAIAAYNNLQRTILRNPNGTTAVMPPMFYNTSFGDNNPMATPPNPPPSDPTHAAVVTEPLRKAWNNTTTTSNAFLVVMTFGYFEVRADPNTTPALGGRVYLGKELFQTVPGDLRKRFVAVVDRSNLAVNPASLTPGVGYLQAATPVPASPAPTPPAQPWFTTLLDDVQPSATPVTFRVNTDAAGNVYVGGVPVNLTTPGQGIWLGFGNGAANNNDGEFVSIVAVTPGPASSGYSLVKVAATQRYHPAGSPVSNLLLGNPGPQPAFDYNNRLYQGVVPYCVQVPYSPTP